jgi:uncharacterized protein YdaU (DUF1376 family)
MPALHYFRWFPKDADTDENYSSMSDTELGFYHRCLNRSWLNNGLPEDPSELARMMRVTPKYLQKVWERVGRCFETRDGRLVNRRQEEERTKAISRSDSATEAVRSRYERTNERSTNETLRAYGSGSVSGSEEVKAEEQQCADERDEAAILRKSLANYFDGRLGVPDDSLLKKCFDAADGASAEEIHKVLKHLHQNGQSPRDPNGPRSFGWFPTVIRKAFANRAPA